MDTNKEIIDEILKKIPRPNYSELPSLYDTLDQMAREIGSILIQSKLFDKKHSLIKFDESDEIGIIDLIKENPKVMVPFFVMICGFSVRELERLYGIKDVYTLRTKRGIQRDVEKLNLFVKAIVDNLKHPIHLETALYKFYKNWEEHQKRHRRGHEAEKLVTDILKKQGYDADKITVLCKNKKREIDCAVPPNPQNLRVAIVIRRGVFRDLTKRVKEYATEFDELVECYPNIRFVVVYFVSPHEIDRLNEIRSRIESEREGKRPYDLVILTTEERTMLLNKLKELLNKLKEWNIKRRGARRSGK